MSRKPYKALGSDLMAAARHDREAAIDTFIACHHAMEKAQLDDPDVGPKVMERIRAQAVNDSLGRHIVALDHALQENAALLRDWATAREAAAHLRALQAEAAKAKHDMSPAGPRPPGPGPGV